MGGKPEFYSLDFGDMVLNLFIHCPAVQLRPGSALEFGSLKGVHIPQGNPPSILGIQQHPVLQPGCLSSVPHTTVWAVGIFQTWSTAAAAEPGWRRGHRGDLFLITSNNGFALNGWLNFFFIFLLHFSQPLEFL